MIIKQEIRIIFLHTGRQQSFSLRWVIHSHCAPVTSQLFQKYEANEPVRIWTEPQVHEWLLVAH